MSFTAADVLALAKAGYNSQQIALLSQAAAAAPESQQAPQPATQQAPQQAQQPAQQPAQQLAQQPAQQLAQQPAQQPAPQPAPQEEKTPEGLQNIMEELSKLTGAIQLQNQLNSQQPKAETAEDIIANIINPPKPQNNNNN